MPESTEVQIARVEEQLKNVLKGMEKAETSRKEQYRQIDGIGHEVQEILNRLGAVEKQLSVNAPTIAEFIEIKHKVQGAGIAGRWLWVIGGFLIGFAASSKEYIQSWIFK